MMSNAEAQAIYKNARDRYIEEHPMPEKTDVPCSRCGATAGVDCFWGRTPRFGQTVHKVRGELWAKLWYKAQKAATDHAWDVENEAWRLSGK